MEILETLRSKIGFLLALSWATMIGSAVMVMIGLYYLQEPLSAKGYYWIALLAVMMAAYLAAESTMGIRPNVVGWGLLAVFSFTIIIGLYTLKESMSVQGYYLAFYWMTILGTFMVTILTYVKKEI